MKISLTRLRFHQLYGTCVLIGAYPAMVAVVGLLSRLLFSELPIQVYAHVEPFFYPEKKLQLLAYVCSAVFVTGYALVTAAFVTKREESERQESCNGLLVLAALAISIAIWAVTPKYLLPFWALSAVFPFIGGIVTRVGSIFSLPKAALATILVSILVMSAMFAPFILCKPRIECEYLGVPTTSRLIDDPQDSVDTGEFLLRHPALGMLKTSGESADTTALMQHFPSVAIAMTEQLQQLIDLRRRQVPGDVMDAVKDPRTAEPGERIAGFNPADAETLIYDEPSGRLIALDRISDDEERRLLGCVPREDQPKINQLVRESEARCWWRADHLMTAQERQFIFDNMHELVSQIYSRRIIHHHNFVLGPIQEVEKGRPISEINMQYGFLFVVLMQKLLHALGGVSLGSYFHLSFSFYPAYLLLAAGSIYYITRSGQLTAVFLGLTIASLGAIGYEFIAIGPGLNPERHFFDVSAFALLFLALRRESRGLLALLYMLCLLAVLNNKQTGLFLVLAVCGATAFRSVISRGVPVMAIMAMCAGVAIYALVRAGRDDLAEYYFEGLDGFPTHTVFIITFSVALALGYTYVYSTWKALADSQRTLYLAMLFYCQMMFLYYIWGGTRFHFLNYAPIYCFTGIIIGGDAARRSTLQWAPLAVPAALGAAFLSMVLGGLYYGMVAYRYTGTFAHHRTFTWDMPKARIVTTMPPQPFQASVDLIDRYAQEPGIAIISEYDNFLPFLADRYSRMPYPDLQWFLNSKTESDEVVAFLERTRPKYLFVDISLGRDLAYDLVPSGIPVLGTLHAESLLRVHRLRVMQGVFEAVRSGYRQKEQAGLLAVWERIDGAGGGPGDPGPVR